MRNSLPKQSRNYNTLITISVLPVHQLLSLWAEETMFKGKIAGRDPECSSGVSSTPKIEPINECLSNPYKL